jgi:hypothetical protein
MENPEATIEKVLEIDPVVDLDYDYKPEDVIRKGPVERTVYVLPSDSLSNSNIVIQNITPPSLTTVTERCFRVQYSLLVGVSFPATSYQNYPFCNAVVGANVNRAWMAAAAGTWGAAAPAYVAGAPALDPAQQTAANTFIGGATGASVCLRAFPLQSCLTTLVLRLNGNSTSIPSNDLVCLQPFQMDDEEVEYYASEFPAQRDSSPLYAVADSYDNRNPLASWSQNSSTQSRASFNATLIYEALTAGVVYRVYRYDITEQLAISPLVWGKCYDAEGLANIVNITMNLRIQDINRAVSAVPFAGYTANPATMSLQCSLQPLTWNGVLQTAQTQVSLLMQYNTQDPVLSARMGHNLFYDYDYIQTDANSNAIPNALTNGSANGAWTGNTLRINTIPDRVLVYIKPRKGQLTGIASSLISDTFLGITGLKINYNNRPNLLSTYTQNDLFRMTVKNGIKQSWYEFTQGVGSIICIDVASDLGLNSDEAAGQNKFNTIQVSGNYSTAPLVYSQNANQVQYDVMTVVITQGKAIISPNKADFTVGGVSTSEVLALSTSKDNVVAAGLRRHLAHSLGGSFFGKLGKMLHKGLSMAKHIKPEHVEMAHKGIGLAQEGLKHLGVGGDVVGGKLRKRHPRAY